MYGGYSGPSDASAIKAAGLELLHFDQVIAQQIFGISTPLVCLVDYQGYRLMAITLLPVNVDTLRYGSNDGGKTVHKDDPSVTEAMENLFKIFNLKDHQVASSSVILRGPGDVEAHGMLCTQKDVGNTTDSFISIIPFLPFNFRVWLF